MAIITMKNARVGTNGKNVALTVPVDGRSRTLNLDPVDAIQIANQIATAAIPLVDRRAPASMEALEIALHPYDSAGLAHFLVATEHGPFVFGLDAEKLLGFSKSAEAALEFGAHGGSA
jgi:hypothetical protein